MSSDFEIACKDEGWEKSADGRIVYAGTNTSVDWNTAEPMAAMAVLFSGKGPSKAIEAALWKKVQR